MNKTKTMLMGFAFFASILIISATCIAGPVQEKANIEAVEYITQEVADYYMNLFQSEQEFISSIEGYDEFGAHWSGFLRNANGEIYIPGTGWIEPDEFWLAIEEFLQALPLEYALSILGQIEDGGPQPCFIIILYILAFILAIVAIALELMLTIAQYIILAIVTLFSNLVDILGEIVYRWVSAILALLTEIAYLIDYILSLIFPGLNT